MSLLWGKREEQRDISAWGPWASSSGESPIRADSVGKALALVPVYAATSYIADQLAAAPWAAYRDDSGIPVKLSSQPRLITDPGVNGLDVYSWKHQMVASLLLRGNAYGYILDWDSRMIPTSVVWLNPAGVKVDESGPSPVFTYQDEVIPRDRLIHIPMYVVPGSVVGLSPIGLFRQQIETGLEAQRVGRNQFKRNLFPPAHLKNTQKALDATQVSEFKKRFLAGVSSGEPFVSGADWELQALQLPATDVNFLTGIKATATQIAAVYRIPPEQIGGESPSDSLTYKNLEQDQIRLNTVTFRPIATRAEAVFGKHTPRPMYIRFNLDAGARADLKTRYEAHASAITSGWKTVDEVRELEELPPLPERQESTVGGTDA